MAIFNINNEGVRNWVLRPKNQNQAKFPQVTRYIGMEALTNSVVTVHLHNVVEWGDQPGL